MAKELSGRLARIFLPGPGGVPQFDGDPKWRDLFLFHEYFHGDTGRGLGASHQTGWTALVIRCLGRTLYGMDCKDFHRGATDGQEEDIRATTNMERGHR